MTQRAVLIGDSLTEHWWDRRKNRLEALGFWAQGIGGQTAREVCSRLPQALAMHPDLVAIWAGTNDIAENGGSYSVSDTSATIEAIGLAICAHGARPLLCTVPPSENFYWNPAIKPKEKIRVLNEAIRELSKCHGWDLADFYQALDDGTGSLPDAYSVDGVHLTDQAYTELEHMLKKVLDPRVTKL